MAFPRGPECRGGVRKPGTSRLVPRGPGASRRPYSDPVVRGPPAAALGASQHDVDPARLLTSGRRARGRAARSPSAGPAQPGGRRRHRRFPPPSQVDPIVAAATSRSTMPVCSPGAPRIEAPLGPAASVGTANPMPRSGVLRTDTGRWVWTASPLAATVLSYGRASSRPATVRRVAGLTRPLGSTRDMKETTC